MHDLVNPREKGMITPPAMMAAMYVSSWKYALFYLLFSYTKQQYLNKIMRWKHTAVPGIYVKQVSGTSKCCEVFFFGFEKRTSLRCVQLESFFFMQNWYPPRFLLLPDKISRELSCKPGLISQNWGHLMNKLTFRAYFHSKAMFWQKFTLLTIIPSPFRF